MNVYSKTKEEFIKFNNSKELFKELYNVCLLFKNSDHWYYCNCRSLRSQTIRCELCKFDDIFDDKSKEKYLITYRNDVEKLKQVVDIYWYHIQEIQKQDQTALDFFNKEYTWNFRDYKNCINISCDLDQIIESNEEIINSNGIQHFLEHYI